MSISRRGFFGSLLGLFGLGGVATAKSVEEEVRDRIYKRNVADLARWQAYQRSLHPAAILTFNGVESLTEPEIERLCKEFESMYCGKAAEGGLFLAAPGCKILAL